jgi:hypothetical protein
VPPEGSPSRLPEDRELADSARRCLARSAESVVGGVENRLLRRGVVCYERGPEGSLRAP